MHGFLRHIASALDHIGKAFISLADKLNAFCDHHFNGGINHE